MVKSEDSIVGNSLSPSPEEDIRSYLADNGGDYLEIGCYRGVFISKMAIKFPDRIMIGIDPHVADGHTGESRGTKLDDVERIFLENISGLQNIKYFKGTTKEFCDQGNFDDLQNVSCIFIDGSHHYEDIVVDVDLLDRITNPRIKQVIFDDLHIGCVNNGIQYFKTKYGDRVLSDERCNTYAKFRLK